MITGDKMDALPIGGIVTTSVQNTDISTDEVEELPGSSSDVSPSLQVQLPSTDESLPSEASLPLKSIPSTVAPPARLEEATSDTCDMDTTVTSPIPPITDISTDEVEVLPGSSGDVLPSLHVQLPYTDAPSDSLLQSSSLNAPSTSADACKKDTTMTIPALLSTAIGPYSTKAGLTKNHFKIPIRDGVFPVQTSIKKGLVVELNRYLTKTLRYQTMSVVDVLCKLYPQVDIKEKALYMAVTRLEALVNKVKRNYKGDTREEKVSNLMEQEFVMRRASHAQSPDTPRKAKLRSNLHEERSAHRAVKRKLSSAEKTIEELKETKDQNTALQVMLGEEHVARVSSEAQCVSLEEEKESLQESVDLLTKQYTMAVEQLEDMSNRFDPTEDSLEHYRNAFEKASADLETLNSKYNTASNKLSHLSTRNVNKRIKRRDNTISDLKKDNEKCTLHISNMSKEMQELREQLKDTQAKLSESIKQRDKLKERLESKTKKKNQLHKDMYKVTLKQATEKAEFTKADMERMEERICVLTSKNRETEQLLALLDDDVIVTFEEGRYTDEIREAIMSLLQMNVAMSKVNDVIRTVLKKLAGKKIGRLPSLGKISHISLEARHLANIEVATAMNTDTLESALGNSIHGDGTTKFHKKWQNFQVTLPDGSSRTMGLTEMASADTDAVVTAFTERVKLLSETLEMATGKTKETAFEEIMCSIKSTMTDQGPTMPQFSDKLKAIRLELLPSVVKNWDSCPPEVKESVSEFGTFFCKMHPLINFAEEINKVMKSFEDITASGKNPHTLVGSEAGVTRLIRTASKAFHHRGCDKSGAEDIFTSYLNNQCDTTNRLPYYVGNRANILFESAAATYFHVNHIINFVNSLSEPNRLLSAVAEDAGEKLHQAELRALGILFKSVTSPLWQLIKTADNVLSLNPTLHHLQQKLEKWSKNGTGLFNGEVAFEQINPIKDDIFDCLFQDCVDPDMEALTIQALEIASCAMLLILNRQCQDQLPGGKYWNLSESQTSSFSNVPATNMIGERDFAILDCLVRQKPNVRSIHLESLIMWANNGTREWLDSLDEETKHKYMTQARAHAPEMLQRYKQRIKEIKAERWENLQKKQKAKGIKEKKKIKERVDLTNSVTSLGGVWCTEEQVNQEFDILNDTKSDEQVRRSLYAQLTFHQKVIRSKANKEFFQLSRMVNGKTTKFTKDEMKNNLIKIICENDLTAVVDKPPGEIADASSSHVQHVIYTDSLEQNQCYAELKSKLAQKIEDGYIQRAIKQSKLHLDKLVNMPHMLENKRVKHKCIDPHGATKWYNALITKVTPSHETDQVKMMKKTMFSIRYEEGDLDDDEPPVEVFPLLVDLKNNDLIIIDPLD